VGSQWLLNAPEVCGGVSDVTTEFGPPFRMTAVIGRVAVHAPPLSEPFEIVTTPELPAGFSNT
jgi:hypothetical protein